MKHDFHVAPYDSARIDRNFGRMVLYVRHGATQIFILYVNRPLALVIKNIVQKASS
jgi:hypothetical protein